MKKAPSISPGAFSLLSRLVTQDCDSFGVLLSDVGDVGLSFVEELVGEDDAVSDPLVVVEDDPPFFRT